MSTLSTTGHEQRGPHAYRADPERAALTTVESESKVRLVWAGLRVSLGAIFLWAFVDKLFGLGFATPPARAWLAGGSPTRGFLSAGTHGPLAGLYQSIAGNPVVDVLFMVGLLAIGVALLLGMGVRIAGWSGALMMLLMYGAAMPPANNPLIDDHIVYAIVLLGLPLVQAGRSWGLGAWWARQSLVRRYPLLE